MSTAPPYLLRYTRVNATSDGDNTVIAAVAGKSILVLGYAINANAAGVVTLQDSAGTPNVFATFEFTDGGGATYTGGWDCPAFQVAVGNAFEISNAAGVDCTGHITYCLID